MSKVIEQTYLRHDQYKDATNLDARVLLHLLLIHISKESGMFIGAEA